jgi:hypothetical protein
MSSTLFGRGTHTQVGAAHRAELVNRELSEIRELLTEIKAIPDTVRELKAMVLEMRQRLDAMNVPQLAPQVTQEQLDELETRIEALKVLQAPQVTSASLQALEKRLEKKITAAKATIN